jgi:hypothetical protein
MVASTLEVVSAPLLQIPRHDSICEMRQRIVVGKGNISAI